MCEYTRREQNGAHISNDLIKEMNALNKVSENETLVKTVISSTVQKQGNKSSKGSVSDLLVNVDTISAAVDSSKVLMNPVLAYIVFALQSGTTENVTIAALGHFVDEQISGAKDMLWSHCGPQVIGKKSGRKGSSARSVAEAHITDIITAWAKLEAQNMQPVVALNAYSLAAIPRSHPEELNNISLVDRLNRLEKRMCNMQVGMDELTAQNLDLRDNMRQLSSYANAVKTPTVIPKTRTVSAQPQDARAPIDSIRTKPDQVKKDMVIGHHGASATAKGADESLPTHVDNPSNKADSEDGFELPAYVRRRHNREINQSLKRNIVSGNAKHINHVKGAPEPSRDLFIFRVDKNTQLEDLQSYISECGFTIRCLTQVSKDESIFKSFKLTVPVSQFKKLFDGNLWPEGIRVRRYWENKSVK